MDLEFKHVFSCERMGAFKVQSETLVDLRDLRFEDMVELPEMSIPRFYFAHVCR
jgi:hypothetical protein